MALGEVYNVKTILLVQKIATAITSFVHCPGVLRVDVSENYFAITITITIPGKEDIQLVRFGKGNRLRHRYIYRCHHSYNYTDLYKQRLRYESSSKKCWNPNILTEIVCYMAKFPHGHDLSLLQLWDGLSYFITSDVVTMLLFNFYAYKQIMFAKLTMFCSYTGPKESKSISTISFKSLKPKK